MIINFFDNESINEDIKNYIQRRIKAYGNIRYSYLLMNKKSTATSGDHIELPARLGKKVQEE